MVGDMLRYLKLYKFYIKINFKNMAQYRGDMLIGILSNLLIQISSIIFLWTIFSNVKTFADWTFYKMMLVYAVFTVCKGLNNIFFDNLWIVGKEFIRKGIFDVLLVRPANELFQIIGTKFQFDGIGTLSLGVASLVVALKGLNISMGLKEIFIYIFAFFMGTLIIAGINLIFTVSSFWVVRSNNVIWMVYSFADFAQYPLEMFGIAINCLLTFVLPYGFVSYYPVCVLLGKLSPIYLVYEAIVTIVIIIVALRLWKFGLKIYESAGN